LDSSSSIPRPGRSGSVIWLFFGMS
jgi:hypothetical protein